MRVILILGFLSAGPAFADACQDWWFTRNLIMDRAGYCFGSVLGQAQFDNSDCTGKEVSLSDADAEAVALIRRYEQEFSCKVDTTRPVLELQDTDIRRKLEALPISDGLESACLTYQHRDTLPLTTGPWKGASVIGEITFGANIGFGHLPRSGWSYVTVHDAEWGLISAGWLDVALEISDCEAWAG